MTSTTEPIKDKNGSPEPIDRDEAIARTALFLQVGADLIQKYSKNSQLSDFAGFVPRIEAIRKEITALRS